jgi:hypothetical protein
LLRASEAWLLAVEGFPFLAPFFVMADPTRLGVSIYQRGCWRIEKWTFADGDCPEKVTVTRVYDLDGFWVFFGCETTGDHHTGDYHTQ